MARQTGMRDVEAGLTATTGRLLLELKSWVPSITNIPPTRAVKSKSVLERSERAILPNLAAVAPARASPDDAPHEESTARDSELLLVLWGAGCSHLRGASCRCSTSECTSSASRSPCGRAVLLVRNAGQNVLVLCDPKSKAEQLKGMKPLDLGRIVKQQDFKRAWRDALFDLDRKSDDGSVVIADFDEGLDDTCGMDRKLVLLEELVFDPSRRVVVLSKVSLRGLTDSVRHSAGASSAAPDARDAALKQMERVKKALVIIERRQPGKTRARPQLERVLPR